MFCMETGGLPPLLLPLPCGVIGGPGNCAVARSPYGMPSTAAAPVGVLGMGVLPWVSYRRPTGVAVAAGLPSGAPAAPSGQAAEDTQPPAATNEPQATAAAATAAATTTVGGPGAGRTASATGREAPPSHSPPASARGGGGSPPAGPAPPGTTLARPEGEEGDPVAVVVNAQTAMGLFGLPQAQIMWDGSTDTHCWIAIGWSERELVVAFRRELRCPALLFPSFFVFLYPCCCGGTCGSCACAGQLALPSSLPPHSAALTCTVS